ncbi:hypothetical protein T484DRAFT_1810412 [Baffinella frigidus]|nr:hypothetical protein T484DRAFT_1810412 [Cryptophyta sp. CCMP2293]
MYRSIFLSAQMSEINKYIPGIDQRDIRKGRAGVRAQAMDYQGKLIEDFMLHVRNTPSPGATSSLAIAKMIVDKAQERFGLS